MPIQEPPPTASEPSRRRRRRKPPATVSGSSSESDSDYTWHSVDERPETECRLSDGGVDLESGELEMKVHSGKNREKRDCRICHMRLVDDDGRSNGGGIELGCSCKGDLAAAHKQCAETWFKIKGNKICEICGTTALNVVGEQTNDSNETSVAATAATALPVFVPIGESRNFRPGRRLMNVLLGCMIFAFIISWLFHFGLLSHHK